MRATCSKRCQVEEWVMSTNASGVDLCIRFVCSEQDMVMFQLETQSDGGGEATALSRDGARQVVKLMSISRGDSIG